MALPVFIAVNQTASDIILRQLALTVPASGQVTLSDYNTISEIQDDYELRQNITDGYLLLSDGVTTFDQIHSLQYMTAVTSPSILNPMTTRGDFTFGGASPAGAPTRLPAKDGYYIRSYGNSADPQFVRILDVAGLIVSEIIGAGLDPSAALQVDSTTKGFLVSRMTNAEMNAIVAPAEGLIVYNTDQKTLHYHTVSGWLAIKSEIRNVKSVASDGSGDFTSIQAAIDSITDAATDNRYVVEVAAGIYNEDIYLKDYITVHGAGWDTWINGSIYAISPVEMTMDYVHVESYNNPAINLTGAPGIDGYELDLLGCFMGSTWDQDAAAGIVRCTIKQDSAILYIYRESETYLVVNDIVNTSINTQQAIYYFTGTNQLYCESFNAYATINTDNPGNRISYQLNDNTNTLSESRIIGYGCEFWLNGTNCDNELHGIRNIGNGFYVLHNLYLYMSADTPNTVKVHYACTIDAPSFGSVVASECTLYKIGIDDGYIYAGSSTSVNDSAQTSIKFYLDTDIQPGRYTGLGSDGVFLYSLSNNFGTHWSSGRFNGAELNADVTSWANVSAVLDGYAGAPHLIFRSGNNGSGYMAKNVQIIPRRYTVGLSGDVDFNSIAAAIYQCILDGAGNTGNSWEIYVMPGTYAESPMVLVPDINIFCSYANRISQTYITASNPNADLFTCYGGSINGFVISGVTDPTKALLRCSTAYALTVLHGVAIENCSTGVYVSNSAKVVATDFTFNINGPGLTITTGAYITGAGSYFGVNGGFFSCPSALLPYYSSNPIDKCIHLDDGAEAYIVGITARVAPKDANADIFYVENGGIVTILASEIANCGNALHIGSSGTNSKITAASTVFANNLLNCFIESSTGKIFANFSTDIERKSIVTGGELIGTIQYRDNSLFRLVGTGKFRYATNKDIDLGDYFYDFSSTGVCERGAVSIVSGLDVEVRSGEGFIRRPNDEDVFSISWSTDTLTLTDNTTNYVYYDSETSLLTSSTSAPSRDTAILLATPVTKDGYVRYLHNTRVQTEDLIGRLNDYLLSTRKFALNSGLAVTQGDTVRELKIGSGSYYRALQLISLDGYPSGATWSYFYGTNGANEIADQTLLDITQYDNAGSLTSLSDGYYRADTVYITSDNRVSLIYGTSQHETSLIAETSALGNIPTFIEPTACILAQVIVQDGYGITGIIDRRPQPGSTSGVGSAGGVSIHSALAGLEADDHTQYLLASGARAMIGSLNMGSQTIINAGSINGVPIASHSSRHNPGGADALATGTPVATTVGSTPSAGSATSYSKSDHQHGVAAGVAPSSISTSNSEGTSSSVARADHVHSHGSQTDGTLHAGAIASGASGFLTGSDKAKLDGIAIGATSTPLTSSAPANVTKAAAVVGIDGYAARSDHKHDISTAITGSATPGDTALEGVATSLARSDHRHSLPAFGTTLGTFCQGNDSRLSDDRTASGLRTATTIVSVSSATAPTIGQALIATSDSAATWQSVSYPSSTEVTGTSTTTTTSSSDVLMSGMTITPAAGTYLVWFSGDLSWSSASTCTIDIWVAGAVITASERIHSVSNAIQKLCFCTHARVTVSGAQAIEGRWRRTGGTLTNTRRTLSIIRVS